MRPKRHDPPATALYALDSPCISGLVTLHLFNARRYLPRLPRRGMDHDDYSIPWRPTPFALAPYFLAI